MVLPLMANAQTNYRSEVWSPDLGDGTYMNPVINADYSDILPPQSAAVLG